MREFSTNFIQILSKIWRNFERISRKCTGKKYFPEGGAYDDARMPNWPQRHRTPLPRIIVPGLR